MPPQGGAPAPPGPGTRLEDQGEIARGGGGSVHRVFDRRLQRHAALKRAPRDAAAGELARFLDEARVMSRLDHPNIVPVYDIAGTDDGDPSILMKLVEGRTLGAILAEQRGLPLLDGRLEPLLQIVLKVCDAIAFAHSRGVIHRDLKPSNVMVGSHGQVYVMDWGLAVVRGGPAPPDTARPPIGDDRSSTELCGTPAYMSPEQAAGHLADIDERTDVFLIGGVLYEILTGQPPHGRKPDAAVWERIRTAAIRAPEEVAAGRDIPAELGRITRRALSARRDDRHASVSALKLDLETFLRSGGWFPVERFAKGELILRAGEPGGFAYLLTEGRCEIHRTVNGVKRMIRIVGPGDVFGEVGLFSAAPRTANVEALTDVAALRVDRHALDRELARSTWMRAFLDAAAARFLELDRSEAGLAAAGPSADRRG
ncbi:MAG: protein kinase [Thermodesulfobacteriota bacterium]